VTSPPYYGLRDYGHDGQIGLEKTPEEYIAAMVEVFRCVWDVLADDGTLWLNIGDSYAMASMRGENSVFSGGVGAHAGYKTGSVKLGKRSIPFGLKAKDLIGIPWMLAFALRADGWYLRQDIIWHKPNPMPELVQDRCTKAHEYIFLLSKSQSYYFDNEAIAEPLAASSVARLAQPTLAKQTGSDRVPGKTNGNMKAVGNGETRNRRSVWTVTTKPYKGAHFATFPPDLIEPCILAGAPAGGVVLDPFMGSGTTAAVAIANGRNYLGCELNPAYKELQDARIGTPKPTDLFGCQYA
jgi:DNA modification methylase